MNKGFHFLHPKNVIFDVKFLCFCYNHIFRVSSVGHNQMCIGKVVFRDGQNVIVLSDFVGRNQTKRVTFWEEEGRINTTLFFSGYARPDWVNW